MLTGFCLSELDLLLHQGRILLKVDVLVVQLVLLRLQLSSHLIILLRELQLLHFIFFFLLVELLLFHTDHVPLRLNLVLKSDLLAFQIGNFINSKFVLFNELAALIVVRIRHLVQLQLVLLEGSLDHLSLLH